MPATLVADLGNTTARVALVTGSSTQPLWSAPAGSPWSAPAGILPRIPPYVASVNPPLTEGFLRFLKQQTGCSPRLLVRDVPLPLQVDYETPRTLGVDRILAAMAAFSEFPKGALVVDAGTALSVDWVDHQGCFRGGAIAPGPELLGRALKEWVAGLEWGDLAPDTTWPGRSSRDCCDLGVTAGLRGTILELVSRARRAAGEDPALLLTGGAAEQVVPLVPELSFHLRPHLVLRGIALAAQADASVLDEDQDE